MDLPSFLWLWRLAAWAMGLTWLLLLGLLPLGVWLGWQRRQLGWSLDVERRQRRDWVRLVHMGLGWSMGAAIVLLLGIGIVGTLGHYGHLGQSVHLTAGLAVVGLMGGSAWTGRVRARRVHRILNGVLCIALIWVSWTGWQVVQKYL